MSMSPIIVPLLPIDLVGGSLPVDFFFSSQSSRRLLLDKLLVIQTL
jgi:hypothetical protein